MNYRTVLHGVGPVVGALDSGAGFVGSMHNYDIFYDAHNLLT